MSAAAEVAVEPGGWRRAISAINPTAFVTVLIWSAIAPFTKYALRDFPTLGFMTFRMGIAAGTNFLYLLLRRQPMRILWGDFPRFLLAGIGFFGLSTLLLTGGLARTTVAHMIILASTGPLVGAVWRGGRIASDRIDVRWWRWRSGLPGY